ARLLQHPAIRHEFLADPGALLLPDDRARRDPAHARFPVVVPAKVAAVRRRRAFPGAGRHECPHLYRIRDPVLELPDISLHRRAHSAAVQGMEPHFACTLWNRAASRSARPISHACTGITIHVVFHTDAPRADVTSRNRTRPINRPAAPATGSVVSTPHRDPHGVRSATLPVAPARHLPLQGD